MKTQKIIYWISTLLFSAWMLVNVYAYLWLDVARRIFTHLGFPGYFRMELAIFKLFGIIVLLVPAKWASLKEWAYAGFFITLLSAFIAHLAAGDGMAEALHALPALALLLSSYYCFRKLCI